MGVFNVLRGLKIVFYTGTGVTVLQYGHAEPERKGWSVGREKAASLPLFLSDSESDGADYSGF